MKALGNTLFSADFDKARARPNVAYERMSAADLELPESWFRDAIFENPELVIGPCREAGMVLPDERWLPWATESNFGAGPVDVLLISSRGRPAIIETKLSYNPQKRREVVAQILDYALSLQDVPKDELPELPGSDDAPDMADLHECLNRGKFLLVVAGDALDSRALRLSEVILGRHLTSEWTLAMVDLNVYRSTAPDHNLLIVPELRGAVVAETRQVVRVQVEGTTPHAKVTVERIPSDESAEGPRPTLASVDEFLQCVRTKSPMSEGPISQIVDCFVETHGAGDGRFVLGLKSATANLYWRSGSGALRRVFAMNENGRFRIWLHYVLSVGREDIADTIRELSRPVVAIAPGETSGVLEVDQHNVDAILAVISSVVATVARMDP